MKNQYVVTKELIKSWYKGYLFRGANIFRFIFSCLLGICGLLMLLICMFSGGYWLYWFLAVLYLSFFVYMLFFSRYVVSSRQYKFFSKTYGVKEWTRTAEFTDDEIILTDHNSVYKFRYENIRKIKDNKDQVIIRFNHNLGVRLYKDSFIEGTWEECKELINSKTK